MYNTSYMQPLVELLAQEKLSIVFDKSVETASIDLEKRRVYIHPFIFEFNNNLVTERLLCHEVGHALYSNFTLLAGLIKKYGKPLVNVFEDIRIENCLKQKFPGITKLFSNGFTELNKCLNKLYNYDMASKVTDTSQFLDRLNVHFKSNLLHYVKFTPEEILFVKKLYSFVEADQLELMILEFLQLEQLKNTDSSNDVEYKSNIQNNSGITNDFSETIKQLEESLVNQEIELLEQITVSTPVSAVHQADEYTATMPNIVDKSSIYQTFKSISRERSKHLYLDKSKIISNIMSNIDKHVAILYTEFKRRKNAKNYRQQHNRSIGVLDLNKVYNYKTSYELFQNQVIKAQQQNHEIIILLDWSTSVRKTIIQLITECITIVKFCKQANIACRVFAFTSNYTKKLVWLEFLSTNSDTFTIDCEYLLDLGFDHCNSVISEVRSAFPMHRTPLYESLFKIPEYIKNKLGNYKKLTLITITDGQSDRIAFPINFIDPLSKSLIHFDDKEVGDYIYKRLKTNFPTLSLIAIHVGSSLNSCLSDNGSLDIFSCNKEQENTLVENIKQQGYAKISNDYLNHLIIKVPDEIKQNNAPANPNKKITKRDIQKLLQNDTQLISKLLYKELAILIA